MNSIGPVSVIQMVSGGIPAAGSECGLWGQLVPCPGGAKVVVLREKVDIFASLGKRRSDRLIAGARKAWWPSQVRNKVYGCPQ